MDFTLTDDEHKQIDHAMNHDERPAVQRRAQAILMLSRGCSVTEVARTLNIKSRTTIYNLWHRFKEHGLDAFVRGG